MWYRMQNKEREMTLRTSVVDSSLFISGNIYSAKIDIYKNTKHSIHTWHFEVNMRLIKSQRRLRIFVMTMNHMPSKNKIFVLARTEPRSDFARSLYYVLLLVLIGKCLQKSNIVWNIYTFSHSLGCIAVLNFLQGKRERKREGKGYKIFLPRIARVIWIVLHISAATSLNWLQQLVGFPACLPKWQSSWPAYQTRRRSFPFPLPSVW